MSESARARVLNVGQCSADHYTMRSMIVRNFFADVDSADSLAGALDAMRSKPYVLVLVNRILDHGGDEGVQLIHAAKREPELAPIPIMLVSNYPDAQKKAIAAGAVPGFGKSDLYERKTVEKLAAFLRGAADLNS